MQDIYIVLPSYTGFEINIAELEAWEAEQRRGHAVERAVLEGVS